MFNRWIHPKAHYFLQIIGLCLIAIGLPLNKVVMSVGTIWIMSNWLIELNFKEKFQRLLQNKIAWLILALFFIHFFGLIWSENIQYGLRDIEKKLPLFVIPFVLASSKSQFDKTTFLALIYAFLISLLVTSICNIYWRGNIDDYRETSIFISHIRYALLLNFAISICVFLILIKQKYKYLIFLLLVWFTFCLIYTKTTSGIFLLFIQIISIGLYFLIKSKQQSVKIITTSILITLFGIVLFYSKKIWNDVQIKQYYLQSKLPKKTKLGNLYTHHFNSKCYERGYPTYLFICDKELKKEWNKRSKIDFDKKINGYQLKFILYRYITSKGYTKDFEGMNKMNIKDIKNVEKGVTSIVETKNIFEKLLYQLYSNIINYKNNKNPNNNSFLQRMEHLKTGLLIYYDNPLFGVGTGDIQDAFNEKYISNESVLDKKFHYRTHSQFLTFAIAFGIIGFILSILTVFLPLINKQNKNLLSILFTILCITSFLFSDLLETQVGVTFFSLYYSFLFLSNYKLKKTLS